MKIGVLGTSNSIIHNGWFPVFSAIEYPNCVVNYSGGANSSAYALYALDHFEILNNVNCLIIDFAVNDQNHYDSGALEFKQIEMYFFELAQRVSNTNIISVNVMFFNERHLNKKSFPIRDLQIDICNHFNIPVVDLLTIIQNMKHYRKFSIFQDGAHLSSHYSKHVAVVIKNRLDSLTGTDRFHRKKDEQAVFSHVPLSKTCKDVAVVTRGTAFVSHDCICVDENGVSCDLGQVYIEGVFFRSSWKNAYLSLESNGRSINKIISLEMHTGFYLRSIRPAFRVDGAVRISSVKIDGALTCAKDQHQVSPYAGTMPVCELVGFLVQTKSNKDVDFFRNTSLEKNNDLSVFDKSFRCLISALRKRIRKVKDHNILYLISTEVSSINEAKRMIDKAIALNDDNPHYYYQLGNLFMKNGDLDGAESAHGKAVELDPEFPAPYEQLCNIYMDKGDVNKAVQNINYAIALNDDNPLYYRQLGDLLRKNGDMDGAESAHRKAAELDPDYPESSTSGSTITTTKRAVGKRLTLKVSLRSTWAGKLKRMLYIRAF